jgi:hypothetical protein
VTHSDNNDRKDIIIRNSTLHAFSNPNKKDTFQIEVSGKSLLDGIVYFRIISFSGQEIYKISCDANDLIGYGLSDNSTNKEKEKFIKDRINNFFNKDNFLIPAIKKTDEYDQDYSDKDVWLDIKSDPTAIGFYYLIGEEDNREIAYSKKNKKVIIYMNFD